VIKNYFYNGLAVALTTIAAILASIVLARTLGPEKWGIYGQIGWLISIAVTLFGGGLAYTAMRFLGTYSLADSSTERSKILLWLVLAQLLLVFPGCLLFLLFAPQINNFMGWHLDPRLIQVSSLGILALSSFVLGSAMLRGIQKYRSLAIISVLSSLITLGTIAVVLRYPDVGVLIAATAVGQLLLVPLFIYLLWDRSSSGRQLGSTHLPTIWRIMIRYSFLVYLTVLVDQVVWQRSEIFFLGQLSDPAQTGYYSLAYTIAGTVIAAVAMAITGTLTPVFSSSADVSGRPHAELPLLYRQSFSLLNWIVLPCAVGLAIVGPTVVLMLYGEAYAPVVPVLYLVIISTVIGVYARPSASVIHALNKPSVLLFGSLAVLPIDLALAWYLVPRQGAIGAAVANLAAQMVGASIAVIYATKVAALYYDWNSIGKSILGCIACGAVSWLAITFIKEPILSVLIAMVIGGIVYFTFGIVLKDETTLTIKSAARSRLYAMGTRFVRQIAG
jgi:O-antigen/teichoic acid export membrane protein